MTTNGKTPNSLEFLDPLIETIGPPLANTIYLAASPFVSGNMYRKYLKTGKYARSGPGMLTMRMPPQALSREVFRCWMHSVSVGESVAAGAFFKRLKAERPEWDYLVTTTTETGQEQARKSLAGADRFAFAPFDFTPLLHRFHQTYRPSLYCFFETEIWPNHLLYLKRHGVPTFLINGKLSGSSTKWYARASSIFRPVLSGIDRFYMQSERDAERMERIVGKSSRIQVTGNVKFDALPEPLSVEEKAELRRSWKVRDDEFLIVAGSTHPDEENLILKAFSEVKQQFPKARLAIAPRHPERFDEVARLIGKSHAVYRTSLTESTQSKANSVILIDQMGVLARWYGVGDIALVGGAWNPIGGHNLLEPAIHGIPILRGPHMHAQPEITRVLSPSNGGLEVSERDLGTIIFDLANNPERAQELGKLAAQAANSSKGSAQRIVEDMLEQLNRKNILIPTS